MISTIYVIIIKSDYLVVFSLASGFDKYHRLELNTALRVFQTLTRSTFRGFQVAGLRCKDDLGERKDCDMPQGILRDFILLIDYTIYKGFGTWGLVI